MSFPNMNNLAPRFTDGAALRVDFKYLRNRRISNASRLSSSVESSPDPVRRLNMVNQTLLFFLELQVRPLVIGPYKNVICV